MIIKIIGFQPSVKNWWKISDIKGIFKYLNIKRKNMDKSNSLILASILIGIIGMVHLIRSILRLPATVGSITIPLYVSYGAVVLAGWISWEMYKASKNKK